MNGQPKIRVGVLGATGAVGQRFVQMLQGHPWFALSVLCASPRNAGKRYADACNWLLRGDMPAHLHDIILQEMTPRIDCQLVFSALPSGPARTIEAEMAAAGYIVCSNASAYRYEPDVPLLIPEVNPEHVGADRSATAPARVAGLHNHQSQLLHDPPGERAAPAARSVRRQEGIRGDDAGGQRGGLHGA